MKNFSKLFVAFFMTAGLAMAGCGGEEADDKKEGSDAKEGASTAVDSTMASTTTPTITMVATNVSLPKMHWT